MGNPIVNITRKKMKKNVAVAVTTAAAVLSGSIITLLTCVPIRIDGKQYASYRVKDMLIHGVNKLCLMKNVCKFDVRNATLTLIEFTEICKFKGIFAVATEGTALGLHRDHQLINHDASHFEYLASFSWSSSSWSS